MVFVFIIFLSKFRDASKLSAEFFMPVHIVESLIAIHSVPWIDPVGGKGLRASNSQFPSKNAVILGEELVISVKSKRKSNL